MTQQAFTIPEFISHFKVGRTSTYEEIGTGRLSTYKVGRRRYISAHAAAEWQRKLEAETNQPASFWEKAANGEVAA